MKKMIAAIFLMTQMVSGKTFTSNFSEFELPRGWDCQLEGSEWVCQSENKKRKKEAIIILAAKKRGKQDELANYQAYLQQSKTFRLPGGKTQVSEPKYTKTKKVKGQNHPWIDSLHMASEVPGFFTRYLATVKGELGVAVTFSVAKDHYNEYNPIFDKIVETLKVFSSKKATPGSFKLANSGTSSVPGSGDFIDDERGLNDIGVGSQRSAKSGAGGSSDMMLILIGAAVVGGLIYLKKKKGGAKGKKKKKKKKKKA
ncbi:MAG: hypothetical protein BM556_15375 [Bacteriovorax sp. MedPE-SWde]|nr:MAG: hypothetical protein BM556_15375 [Bacteriovorax sp. MedPE-SWde]